jgi:hypothetical protein
VATAQASSLVVASNNKHAAPPGSQPGASTREVFSTWILLAIFAGALLAAYGFFVWRHETQRRKEVGGQTRRIRRAF